MSQKPSRNISTILGIGLLAIGVVIVVYLVSQMRMHPPLERSAIGFDGLVQLLDQEDRSARTFVGGNELDAREIGVRVVPLFGEDMGAPFRAARSEEERYLLPPARYMPPWVLERKVETAPTLIILPKWSDGVRLSGLAHPEFLLGNESEADAVSLDDTSTSTIDDATEGEGSEDETSDGVETSDSDPPLLKPDAPETWDDEIFYREDLDDDGFDVPPLIIPEAVLSTTDTVPLAQVSSNGLGTLSLRAPQYVRAPKDCVPLIGDREQALLMECSRRYTDVVYWILSDPDALNNHGLHLCQNARAALNIMDRIGAGGEVVLDYSTQVWSIPEEDRRTLAELARFFAPPFAWIWLAALLLFALAFWRGFVRDRPLSSVFAHGHGATRYNVVAAQSRLMRNTGRDGALLRVLAHQRVLTLCDHLLGRDERVSDRKSRMLAFVERRSPELSARLVQVLEDIDTVAERLAPSAAVALLTRLETAYEEARQLA